MRVQIHLRAEKLKNLARGKWRGKRSSPYCKVVSLSTDVADSINNDNDVVIIGMTEVQHGNLNPQFTTSMIVDHDESQGWTHLRITIRDCRRASSRSNGSNDDQSQRTVRRPLHHLTGGVGVGINTILDYGNHTNENDEDDDYRNDANDPKMGQVDLEIGHVLRCKGQETELQLSEGGTLFVHITESIQGESAGVMDCQIRGLDVKNIESGLLGLGAVDPYYVISKKYNDTHSGLSRWYAVYKSEHIHDIINPYWKSFKMDLERLCNNDLNKEIKIAIYDQEDYGQDRWLGEVQTSVAEMQQSVAKCGNADRESALRAVAMKDDETKEDLRALLVILKADVIPWK